MHLREHFGDYAGGLEHALALATLAHASIRHRGGEYSSLHPVLAAMALPEDDTDMRTVALLRDVMEESELTLDDLRREGFPEHIVRAVDSMQFRRLRFQPAEDRRLSQYHNALEIFDVAS